jgi:hypothetical protein
MPAAFAGAGPDPAARQSITNPQMRPVASPAAFKSEPKRRRPRRDGATISASPVKASRPAATRVHSVVEVARLAFNKDPSNGTHFDTNP